MEQNIQDNINTLDIRTDTRSRNWVFTINNPVQSESEVYDYLISLQDLKYFCFTKEQGEKENTLHYQGYIEFRNKKSFSQIKTYLSEPNIKPNAHMQMRAGSAQQARDYVFKQGKYIDKANTKVGITLEYGEFSNQGKRNDLFDIMDMLKEGATDDEILDKYPTQVLLFQKQIDVQRQKILQAKYKGKIREVEVTYIHGSTGKGKTTYVMQKHGVDKVYRVTTYDNSSFDNYNSEDVILFEEFRSSFKIGDMLSYLDVWPLMLPARYYRKVAVYTKVYIVSNIPLSEQYKNVQKDESVTFDAFKRRIKNVIDFDKLANINSRIKILFLHHVMLMSCHFNINTKIHFMP